jgi:hypothetical protein
MGSTTGAWAPPRFRWLEHLGIAALATAIMPFTALAWPFALFTGFVLGQVWLAQRLGRPPAGTGAALRIAAIGAGMVGMIVFGLLLGGLVSFAIAGLAALSEARAPRGTMRQQLGARVLVVGIPALTWLLLFSGTGLT